ncbi:hypothetical protein [Noviherbaspirillum cavernae]|nr:hypothetical protein [Noviherbaspirillum cavernae]
MATLHGILAELGIENPDMHPEREMHHAAAWIVDRPFEPIEGESYELAYGKLLVDGGEGHVIKKVRIDGVAPQAWIDLDTGRALDSQLQMLPVRGFRLLQ